MREKGRGSQEKERSGHLEVSGLITHTHRGCGPFALTRVVISQLASVEEMGCLLALTVLGGLSASQQLLHCELCRGNVNLPLSCGDFKLKQNREARDRNKER